MADEIYDVVIVGGGPAGYTAGIYTSRGGLRTLVLTGPLPGGQLVNTTEVENYPGFAKGILGPNLMTEMKDQTKRVGAEVVDKQVVDVDFSKRPFVVKTRKDSFSGKSVIIATGANPRKLGVKGELEYSGKGVSYCALCDGPFFKDKVLVIVGGGDAAMEEANFLTKFASRVHLVHRRDEFRASKVMQDKVFANKKIEVHWNTELEEVKGDKMIGSVVLKNNKSGESSEMEVGGVFISVGHVPNTSLFEGKVELDKQGYLVLKEGMMTSVDGVYAAGDVHDHKYKQAVTAAAFGCMAAIEAERGLGEKG
ncbi:thioredoxin-disulfide reductase [Candidatus Pacearchaeota archaeon]|nr:thioredoxin-disulfide reductase [Candidatus Pacearchaeota archaeon]|tara:strand:+ start:3547 stop:4473 length:927 start_codon:yes stop_codon:yes gene_type:complete